jgi:hypothetical protein
LATNFEGPLSFDFRAFLAEIERGEMNFTGKMDELALMEILVMRDKRAKSSQLSATRDDEDQ